MLRATSFVFDSYRIDRRRSTVIFTYRVEFARGISKTFTDRLTLEEIEPDSWDRIPKATLEATLQALLIMVGINYWCIFPTKNIRIERFSLSREQAAFWDSLYLNGLGEFFYEMKTDFRGLISFPYDEMLAIKPAERLNLPTRALLLNGAGKDSVLSAEILKASGAPYDFFAFAPTPAHEKIAALVGANMVRASRRRDPLAELISDLWGVSRSYPSVSTFTFISVLMAQLKGYNSIIFSNERSADFGNLDYLGLRVNHQWCKSSEAEAMTNGYIQRYISQDISTRSLLRAYSELEIVRRFVRYPQYLRQVTSCNSYFWLPRPLQHMHRTSYWCKKCPKCVFLFACFAAYLPKSDVIQMFGADLFADQRLLPLVRSILGIEGFKPLDCVGEPEEMALAMHLVRERGEYKGEPAIQTFEQFYRDGDFAAIEKRVLSAEAGKSID